MSEFQSLRRTVAAANAGNAALAKMHLQKAAEDAPEDAGVWLWMAWFADSPLNAVHCLELALDDPRYQALAQAGLNWARAMAAFKVADAGLPVALPSAVPVVSASESVVEVEQELVADIAEVAAEVASTIAAPVETFEAPVAVEATVEAAVAEPVAVASSVVESVAAQSDWDAPAEFEPVIAVAEEVAAPIERTPVVESFAPSRAFASGTTRASLWGGLGASTEASSAASPTTDDWGSQWQPAPVVIVPQPPVAEMSAPPVQPVLAEVAPSALWNEAAREVPFTVSENVVPEVAVTVTAATNESEQVTTSSTVTAPTPPKVVEAQPTVWRAAKTDWFGAEPQPQPEPFIPATTSRLADVMFAPPSETVAEASSHRAEPVAPVQIRVAEPYREEVVSDSTRHFETAPQQEPQHEEDGHGDFLEDQLAEEPEVVDELVEVVEADAITNAKVADIPQVTTPAPAKSGKTILVVDDSPTVRKLVAMTLEKRGYTVVAAFDGVAAIKEIATHNPALILMDVTMPRLDGYQLCKLVKKHEATRHIPVVMLSGKDGMFDRLRGRLVGCSGYISKPFVPEALVETVEEHLAQLNAK